MQKQIQQENIMEQALNGTNKIIPIRLSDSALTQLGVCERMFQLDRLLKTTVEREDTEHTVFGKAYGAGIASYLVSGDTDMALYQAWLSYYPELETDKKNQARCFAALITAFPRMDSIMEEYEVVTFNGKPAVELSFRINISEHYYFVGYIDVVLRNKFTGVAFIGEVKTTGLQFLDLDPAYKNSGQALGYSIVLDRIVGQKQSSYGVLYLVAQLGREFKAKHHILPYDKTLLDRLNWFLTLGQDVQRLNVMRELDVYPTRGKNCIQFMRPCKFFGVCGLKSFDVLKERQEDTVAYDFTYELEDLVSEHIERVAKQPTVIEQESDMQESNKPDFYFKH